MTTAQRPRPPAQTRPLTVASVPSGHVYVRHLAPLRGGGDRRLPDPVPDVASAGTTGQWWPPVMLDPTWARAADMDVFHLHFGFDARSPRDLAALVDALRVREVPFVFTVHDLRNPHHQDRRLHDAQLDVLVPAADALVTLTPGAAREIEQRWGRTAEVIPHPHVVDLQTMSVALKVRPMWRHRPFRVGLHLKSLRPSMAPLRILPTLVETVHELQGAALHVNGHRDVLDQDGGRHDRPLATYLRDQHDRGRLELSVHDYFSDRELWSYLASLDVSVLPYRFGTHSGWLEACRDLQTTVIAPTCGYFADQGPVLSYDHDEETFDPESLRRAVLEAHAGRPRLGATIEERTTQRQAVAAAHASLYRSLLR